MTKERQEKYIQENIGYIIQEYQQSKAGKNKLALLMEEGLLIVNLSEFLKGAEPKQRNKYKRYFKGCIRSKIIPVISITNENKLIIYNLQREKE